MKKFLVRMSVSLDYDFEVEAKDEDDARNKALASAPSYDPESWEDGGIEVWDIENL